MAILGLDELYRKAKKGPWNTGDSRQYDLDFNPGDLDLDELVRTLGSRHKGVFKAEINSATKSITITRSA